MRGDRLECKRCQVLFNETDGDRTCWYCGGPTVAAFQLYTPHPWAFMPPTQENPP